jgi:hypothetical protein
MIREIPYAIVLFAIAYIGLQLSNYAVDKGVNFPLARKIGHICCGIPYLISPFLFTHPWWPIIASGFFTLLLTLTHFLKGDAFRGVGGISRPGAAAEITYPLGATICLAVGWAWLGNAWLGVIPILFMSFGDGLSGLTRFLLYSSEPMPEGKLKRMAGTLVFIFVCMLVALPFKPHYWICLFGIALAAGAESIFSERGIIRFDDNLPIQLTALITMASLFHFYGG